MCGIAGIFAYEGSAAPVNQAELLRIRERMIHRGPDGAGLWISDDQRIGLAHRRLAIIDLTANGAQPMATPDGRFQIVFNGEIYNYRELRAELQRNGIQLRGQSDTEVLLHLYATEGASMCRRLRGMYAFGIWDTREQSLFLARDPFGIKPLYVQECAGVLRFASEVKALLAGGGVSSDIDLEAEYAYWIWGHVPEPRTIYRQITSLPAGSWRRIWRGGPSESGVIESVAMFLSGDGFDANQPLRNVLLDSVRHHLLADVPVGVFLSSGIDSAALTALAAECTTDLRTVTLGFEEYRGGPKDETVLAGEIAARSGTRHETVWLSRKELDNDLEAFVDTMDHPTIDGLNTWLVSRAASRMGLKVTLSGIGGDEFFGGYPSFHQVPKIVDGVRSLPLGPSAGRWIRKLSTPVLEALFRDKANTRKVGSLVEYGVNWEGAYLLRRGLRMPWELSTTHVAPPADGLELMQLPRTVRVHWLESTRYMRDQLLRDADWSSMAHSLELRLPFVDRVVVGHVGARAQCGTLWTKPDIASVSERIPDAVRHRPKLGFVVPVGTDVRHHRLKSGSSIRGWQERVLQAYLQGPEAMPQLPRRSVALWAPDMATRGGVQSYMWRLWEMLIDRDVGSPGKSRAVSLVDQRGGLNAWPNRTPVGLRPEGAGRRRLRFALYAMGRARAQSVIVGHLHHAPIALVAKLLRCIDEYHVVLHGIEAWRRRSRLERLSLKHAASIVATTQYTADVCAHVNDLRENLFRVIPLCAAPELAEPRDDFALSGEWPILFVGRLDKADRYKGLEPLLLAVAQLVKLKIPVMLHVIGDGDARKFYEALARNSGITDHVAFHGRVDDGTLAAAYSSAKVFVMPSAKEGFGIVFLEAMRRGIPCVGGAHGGTPEVFRDGQEGRLVTHGDVDILTATLLELYRDPKYAEVLGHQGELRFKHEFMYSSFRDRWHALFDESSVL